MIRQTGGTARSGNLDQVEALLSRDSQRLLRRHDAQLRARVVDDPDLANPDPFVYPRAVIPARASVESDKLPPGQFRPRRSSFLLRGEREGRLRLLVPDFEHGLGDQRLEALRAQVTPDRLRTATVASAASRSPATGG